MAETSYLIIIIVLSVACLALAWLFLWQRSRTKTENSRLREKIGKLETANASQVAQSAQYKLDPHLLKNALNAIQSHAYQSYFALDKLSNVLDYILYESDTRFVSLKHEIAFAQNLIEINRLKVSPLFDLHIRKKIDETAENLPIAPLITINPIENAFKHADIQSEHSFISVIFEVEGGKFMLSVSNKTQPGTSSPPREKGGLGDKAYKTRLDELYGENYTLETKTVGDVYRVRLEITLK